MGIEDIKEQGVRLRLWYWEKLPEFVRERYEDPIQYIRESKAYQQLYSPDNKEFEIQELEEEEDEYEGWA